MREGFNPMKPRIDIGPSPEQKRRMIVSETVGYIKKVIFSAGLLTSVGGFVDKPHVSEEVKMISATSTIESGGIDNVLEFVEKSVENIPPSEQENFLEASRYLADAAEENKKTEKYKATPEEVEAAMEELPTEEVGAVTITFGDEASDGFELDVDSEELTAQVQAVMSEFEGLELQQELVGDLYYTYTGENPDGSPRLETVMIQMLPDGSFNVGGHDDLGIQPTHVNSVEDIANQVELYLDQLDDKIAQT